ncbi:16S rRNA (cytosine(1402)-N(4))-methyltransferase RsmH [candidate division WOR-3 bacterium]|nr:16S rRNA (cytosine(1402)-N(4))-methyltransferase RsmH [candidate division WOR-3 bacterium]
MSIVEKKKAEIHEPVLASFVVAVFSVFYGGSFLDLTAGQGGHSQWILRSLDPSRVVCVDRDKNAIDFTKNRLVKYSSICEFLNVKFSKAVDYLIERGDKFDAILADLGMSSMQLSSDRGFSYKGEQPLDMRMDQSQTLNLQNLISDSSLDDIKNILSVSGKRDEINNLATAIFKNKNCIKTTKDLADIVRKNGSKKDAAKRLSRSFQSFRIAVNQEIEELGGTLAKIPTLVNQGGRIAIISYHSVEDSLVKRCVLDWENNNMAKRVFKRTIKPSREEKLKNSKSRSALLRCAEFWR